MLLVCASNLDEARQALAEGNIFLLLADTEQMSVLEGLLALVSRQAAPPPVVLCSNNGSEQPTGNIGWPFDEVILPLTSKQLEIKLSLYYSLFQYERSIERLRFENQLVEEGERRLKNDNKLLLQAVAEPLLAADLEGRITFVNNSACQMLMSDSDGLIGRLMIDFIPVDLAGNYASKWRDTCFYTDCVLAKVVVDFEIAVHWHGSERCWRTECLVTPMLHEGECVGVVVTLHELAEKSSAEKKLRRILEKDPLTGTMSRSAFDRVLSSQIQFSARHHQQFSLLFVGLDRFKQVNDSFGHECGDLLLELVAGRIVGIVGENCGRFGGDEFVILHGNIDSIADSGELASLLLLSLAEPYIIKGNTVYISASIGITDYPNSSRDSSELLNNAGLALSQAKSSGGNVYRYYVSGLQHHMAEELVQLNLLRSAIENNELTLRYQPQVDVLTGRVVGFEALVRWLRCDGTLVMPDQFIPLAESNGMLKAIDRWVLEQACIACQRWIERVRRPIRISVNISAAEFGRPQLLKDVSELLQLTELPANCLTLEVTERLLIDKHLPVREALQSLHNQGVLVAIDDFGTGYSSLSYLQSLPVDEVKIDRSFVKNIYRSSRSEHIIKSIISLAKDLDCSLVAEGVETEQQSGFLASLGCGVQQGYLFNRPMSEEQAMALLCSERVRAKCAGGGAVDLIAMLNDNLN
ncbi:putative bifunctional diguanylate cyclase/phosphodiesterase [Sinobacterium caligoides]|uniref:putative bifunctional diguanylate cyclase/phosphodiesterase n=1 Tax=Sinobacterium caligoides TaxID=933926 RepID=UPI0011CEB6DC|nr:bifunctional diguanylate cyclase/phosphodiesterase [Sinobacterium caligoides]